MLLRCLLFLERLLLPHGIENEQLLQYMCCRAYQLSVRVSIKTIDTHARTIRNDNKTKRIDIEMIVEMKQNINHLLAATVCVHIHVGTCCIIEEAAHY